MLGTEHVHTRSEAPPHVTSAAGHGGWSAVSAQRRASFACHIFHLRPFSIGIHRTLYILFERPFVL